MNPARSVRAVLAIALLLLLGLVVRNQVKVHQGRQARAALRQQQHAPRAEAPGVVEQRQRLFDMLQPAAISNCRLERFGEAHDGGYLMCANLLEGVQAGYSYGIGGYDQWGCDISTALDVVVHQYDCFDTTRPSCRFGDTAFHEACVAQTPATTDGRVFDTIEHQLTANDHGSVHVVVRIDVEGAEWGALLSVPEHTLARIDQLAVEFHWDEDAHHRWTLGQTHARVLQRLRQYFEIAYLHFNNASCVADLAPFPASAYEVLFVNKRLAVVDASVTVQAPHPLDAPTIPRYRIVSRGRVDRTCQRPAMPLA